jgi:hypothetical protein
MEDNIDFTGQFAHEFMLFAMELNRILKLNKVEEIKF